MTYKVTFCRAVDEMHPTIRVFGDGLFSLGVEKHWQLRASDRVICSSERFQTPKRPCLMNDNER